MRRTLCKCMRVAQTDVLRAIRSGARSVDAVGFACAAGTGCGSCHEAIGALIQEELQRRSRAAAAGQLALFDG